MVDRASRPCDLLGQLDPKHASRSTLEVKTRRLLVAHRMTDFAREFPLDWNGGTYFFDFAFEADRTILETNGRRWHDDPADYEDDHEKWSVPGRHGYRLVLATWEMVTRQPDDLIHELVATMAPCRPEPIGSVVGAPDRESKSPWQLEGALAGGQGDRRRTA